MTDFQVNPSELEIRDFFSSQNFWKQLLFFASPVSFGFEIQALFSAYSSLQCLRIQGENIVLKDKLSDAISKIPDKKVSIVSLLMKSKYTDHGFGHIFDFAASFN